MSVCNDDFGHSCRWVWNDRDWKPSKLTFEVKVTMSRQQLAISMRYARSRSLSRIEPFSTRQNAAAAHRVRQGIRFNDIHRSSEDLSRSILELHHVEQRNVCLRSECDEELHVTVLRHILPDRRAEYGDFGDLVVAGNLLQLFQVDADAIPSQLLDRRHACIPFRSERGDNLDFLLLLRRIHMVHIARAV